MHGCFIYLSILFCHSLFFSFFSFLVFLVVFLAILFVLFFYLLFLFTKKICIHVVLNKMHGCFIFLSILFCHSFFLVDFLLYYSFFSLFSFFSLVFFCFCPFLEDTLLTIVHLFSHQTTPASFHLFPPSCRRIM